MTVAEELREIGREEGRIEGRDEGSEMRGREAAFNMFSKNYNLDEVSDILNLTSSQALSLKRQWDQSN